METLYPTFRILNQLFVIMIITDGRTGRFTLNMYVCIIFQSFVDHWALLKKLFRSLAMVPDARNLQLRREKSHQKCLPVFFLIFFPGYYKEL